MRSRHRRSLRFTIGVIAIALMAAACSTTSEAEFSSGPSDGGLGDATSGAATPTPDPACNDDDPRPSLGPPDSLVAPNELPSGSYMSEIRSRGTLRAGVGVDTLLFGYLNPQSGDLEGFDVEMARLVADAIFGDPDQVEFIPLQSADRISALQTGTVDIVVKTMTINCVRWGDINFSTVYYESGQRLLVGDEAEIESIDSIDDEIICAVEGTTSLNRLQESGVATLEGGNWTDCLVAFQQGRADGISTDDTILAGLAAQDPYAKVVGPRFSDEPYGIGLPQDHPEFTEFVNAVLAQARDDGTWLSLYDTWLADTLGATRSAPPASYRR